MPVRSTGETPQQLASSSPFPPLQRAVRAPSPRIIGRLCLPKLAGRREASGDDDPPV